MTTDSSTESRGDRMLRRLRGMYGARFIDMWRDVPPEEVRAEWDAALRGMKREDVQRGVAALYRMRFPPTVPEFLEACTPPPPQPLAHQFRLEDEAGRTDSATARAKLADIAARVAKPSPGIEWARRIVVAATTEHVPALKLAMAQEAIRQWEITNAPHSREPGEDDELPDGDAA